MGALGFAVLLSGNWWGKEGVVAWNPRFRPTLPAYRIEGPSKAAQTLNPNPDYLGHGLGGEYLRVGGGGYSTGSKR